MFGGEYRHNKDSKNRVFMPAKLREELGETFVIAKDIRETCLKVYSLKGWEEYIAPLKAQNRKLSEKRIFPAMSLNKSGTRREDLLMDQDEMEAVWAMRRAMANRPAADVTEEIVENLAHTRSNKDFIQVIKKVLMED